MKHIKKYNNYQIKNEGVKDLVAGGLMALSTLGSVPDAKKEKDNISQNQITQSDSSGIIIKSSIEKDKLDKSSIEGFYFIGTDVYYDGDLVAELSPNYYHNHDFINKNFSVIPIWNITNFKYNYLAVNIIKFCSDKIKRETGIQLSKEKDKNKTNIKVEKEREDLISDLIIYPNPLTEESDFLSVRFNLLEKAEVNIIIFDILGRKVLEKNEGIKNKGTNTIKIRIDDFHKLGYGNYFVRIKFNDIIYTKRFVISIISTEKLDFIGMDITYEGDIIARLYSIDHYWDDKKLIFVDKITYTIVDKKYNYLYKNILKLCRERKPNYEVEIEIVK
jgi:hypothetical protein